MKPASRRTFLVIVFTSVMATAAEAWAGIFRRCRLRRRRTSCQSSCTPCETSLKTAAPADGQEVGCENKICLQALVAEVQDVNGKCVFRQYDAHKCLAGGGHENVNYEMDCSYSGPLPQGSCSTAQTCSSCGLASDSIEVPVLPGEGYAQPAGQKHRADKGLATNGTELLGDHCSLADGARVADGPDIIELPSGGAKDVEKPRLAQLEWITLPKGEFVGIGFEILEGVPTTKEVKHKHLVEKGDKKNSYSVTAKSKKGEWRHYAVYMLR